MMNFDTKQNLGKLLRLMGAFGIVLTALTPAFASATFSHRKQVESAPSSPQAPPAITDDFTLYDSDWFSVSYPKTWQVTPQDDGGITMVSASDESTMGIRSEIIVLRENPDTAVRTNLDQIVAEAVSVRRYSLVTVNGYSGFRIWYEPAPNQQALVTFIGYGQQQTAILKSYYGADDTMEPLVTTMHDSFVNHSVPQGDQP